MTEYELPKKESRSPREVHAEVRYVGVESGTGPKLLARGENEGQCTHVAARRLT